MEFDRDNLPASIDVAEKAIHQRLRDCRLHTLSDLAERLEKWRHSKGSGGVTTVVPVIFVPKHYNARVKLRARRARKKT
jgi:hypothetical protein